MKEQLHGFLGLLNRGGALLIGEALRLGINNVSLIVLADDAKESTKKLYQEKANHRKIPLIIGGSKEELGHAIGYDEVASIGIQGKKAAEKILQLLREGEES